MSDKQRDFDAVVMFEYPRRGIWSLGFVTSQSWDGANDVAGEALVNIFMPTTPNPTSGWFLMVPRSHVVETGLTVETAFKIIMSGGIVQPPDEAEGPPPVEQPTEDAEA